MNQYFKKLFIPTGNKERACTVPLRKPMSNGNNMGLPLKRDDSTINTAFPPEYTKLSRVLRFII